jgi:peroxiredoxin
MNRLIIFPLMLLLSTIAQAAAPLDNLSVVPEVARHSASDFEIEKLGGGKAGLADYKGKLVLLNFWATWCIPCREEMPGMETLWQKYKEQGFVVLAVSVDEGSKSRIEKYSKMFNLSFPILLDPESEVSDLYKVSNMPTSFLIDGNGKVISRIVGTEDWSSPAAVELVEKLLSD